MTMPASRSSFQICRPETVACWAVSALIWWSTWRGPPVGGIGGCAAHADVAVTDGCGGGTGHPARQS